jgi:sterol 24-C-methyltransferase
VDRRDDAVTGPAAPSEPWAGAPPEQIADRYYDATTWIYRRVWGPSFHFAPLRRGEPRAAAIARYEREMAAALRVGPAARCLDLGCGVGGPARVIAAATGARVVGLNANLGQLRVMRRTPSPGVAAVGGDFARLPFGAATFDAAYAFEALCHAVDLAAALREVRRVLRRGGTLCVSDWCLTNAFRPDDPAHRALRARIEAAYGVAHLRTWPEWDAALGAVGFTIVASEDRAARDAARADAEPWYRALQPRDRTLDSLVRSGPVRALQAAALAFAERVRLAPAGTAGTVRRLRDGTAALVAAGSAGIFTPMRLVVATG